MTRGPKTEVSVLGEVQSGRLFLEVRSSKQIYFTLWWCFGLPKVKIPPPLVQQCHIYLLTT